MRGALDDRPVIGCIMGCYFGLVNDDPTRLLDFASATLTRYGPRADLGYKGDTPEDADFLHPLWNAV